VKKVFGVTLISIPIIAFFTAIIILDGWEVFWGFIAMFTLCIIATIFVVFGISLLVDEPQVPK
jgi:hypothetical protein